MKIPAKSDITSDSDLTNTWWLYPCWNDSLDCDFGLLKVVEEDLEESEVRAQLIGSGLTSSNDHIVTIASYHLCYLGHCRYIGTNLDWLVSGVVNIYNRPTTVSYYQYHVELGPKQMTCLYRSFVKDAEPCNPPKAKTRSVWDRFK